jgi:hypothetical protein
LDSVEEKPLCGTTDNPFFIIFRVARGI